MTAAPAFQYKSGPIYVGFGLTVEFTLDARASQIAADWTPDVPRGIVAASVIPNYRKARDAFLASLDVNVLVVEP